VRNPNYHRQLIDQTQIIEPGERIAQMIIAKYEMVEWEENA